jgi:hypothetical protein
MSNFIEFVAWAFTATNAVRALFYVPQIVAVARSVDGARDIALVTWWMLLVNNLLGAVYAWLALANAALAWAFMASVLGCAVTITLALYKRWRMPTRRVVEREVRAPRPTT